MVSTETTAEPGGERAGPLLGAFVRSLVELAEQDDRAALARLRRTAGKSMEEAIESYRYVAPYTEGIFGWRERCRYLIAGLFASHPPRLIGEKRVERFPSGDLGEAFARLAPRGAPNRDAVERRFTQLLAADGDELPDQLRQAISLLQAGDVPVNWQILLWNIERWQEQEHRVQRDWARAFWKLPRKPEEGDESEDESETDGAPESGAE